MPKAEIVFQKVTPQQWRATVLDLSNHLRKTFLQRFKVFNSTYSPQDNSFKIESGKAKKLIDELLKQYSKSVTMRMERGRKVKSAPPSQQAMQKILNKLAKIGIGINLQEHSNQEVIIQNFDFTNKRVYYSDDEEFDELRIKKEPLEEQKPLNKFEM